MFHGFARSVLSAEAGRDMGARFALPVLQPLSLAFTAAQLGQVKATSAGSHACIAVDLVIAGNATPPRTKPHVRTSEVLRGAVAAERSLDSGDAFRYLPALATCRRVSLGRRGAKPVRDRTSSLGTLMDHPVRARETGNTHGPLGPWVGSGF